MPLQQYARVLWKRGWIVILLAVIAGLSAYVVSKSQTPIYKSAVTLSAVPARPDYGQSLAIKNLLRNYVVQMQSPGITQQVIDKLQLDVTTEKFESTLNFSANEDTLTIVIEARDPLPVVAARKAQTLAEVFVSVHNQENLQIDQRDRILVSMYRNATSPEIFSPKTSINTIAGTILGALIGLLIIFGLEYLESDVVRTTEDIERYLGVPALGLIPTMMNGNERAAARRLGRKESQSSVVSRQ
jgi:capsular polysaccharide biosynthesis protein